MLSTKKYNNSSYIFANTAKINKLECDEAIIGNYPSNSQLQSTIQDVYSVISSNFNNYYIKLNVDSKIAGSYNPIIDRLDSSHYTINQINSLYYDKIILMIPIMKNYM